jgi:hypothetical protein
MKQTVFVSSENVNEFFNLLHEADFWSLPTAKSEQGPDGQEWLVANTTLSIGGIGRWKLAILALATFYRNSLLKVEIRKIAISQESAHLQMIRAPSESSHNRS